MSDKLTSLLEALSSDRKHEMPHGVTIQDSGHRLQHAKTGNVLGWSEFYVARSDLPEDMPRAETNQDVGEHDAEEEGKEKD